MRQTPIYRVGWMSAGARKFSESTPDILRAVITLAGVRLDGSSYDVMIYCHKTKPYPHWYELSDAKVNRLLRDQGTAVETVYSSLRVLRPQSPSTGPTSTGRFSSGQADWQNLPPYGETRFIPDFQKPSERAGIYRKG